MPIWATITFSKLKSQQVNIAAIRIMKSDNNLWKYRKIKGLKQKDIAYYLGIKNISQISRWEKGYRFPSLKNCFKLSLIYECSLNDLFFDLKNEAKIFVNKKIKSKSIVESRNKDKT